MTEQICSQFDSKNSCKNPSEIHLVGIDNGFAMDFCHMHNHMKRTGIPLKCWRCGDSMFAKYEEEFDPNNKITEGID